MPLVIIDFDYTIANGHTHNIICCSDAKDTEQQWESVKDIKPVGSAEEWNEVLTTLLDNKHQVAIASFNAFGHIIPRYLKEVIGLKPEQLEKIHIESWLPENPNIADKNTHIENIKKTLNFKEKTSDIILVDDGWHNITRAAKESYSVIVATKDGAHLKKLMLVAEKKPDLIAEQKPSLAEKNLFIDAIKTVSSEVVTVSNELPELVLK